MRTFISDRVWSPLGSRPHLLLTADQALADGSQVTEATARIDVLVASVTCDPAR